jgi:uncharacterized protein (TIGR02449 family)
MDNDIQVLGERVSRLVEISRRLAEENRELKGRLGDAVAARADLEQRIAVARARVESALTRLPITQDAES